MIDRGSMGWESREARADCGLRAQLFTDAHGPDHEAARAALDSLRRIYRLRLPLVEARLNGASRRDV